MISLEATSEDDTRPERPRGEKAAHMTMAEAARKFMGKKVYWTFLLKEFEGIVDGYGHDEGRGFVTIQGVKVYADLVRLEDRPHDPHTDYGTPEPEVSPVTYPTPKPPARTCAPSVLKPYEQGTIYSIGNRDVEYHEYAEHAMHHGILPAPDRIVDGVREWDAEPRLTPTTPGWATWVRHLAAAAGVDVEAFDYTFPGNPVQGFQEHAGVAVDWMVKSEVGSNLTVQDPEGVTFRAERVRDDADPASMASSWAEPREPTVKDLETAAKGLRGTSTGPIAALLADEDLANSEAPKILFEPKRYSVRQRVLDSTRQAVMKDRNASYGPPTQDFDRTAGIVNELWGHMLKEPLKGHHVAEFIMCVKLSRMQHSANLDNFVDMAGYAACGAECVATEEGLLDEWGGSS